MVCLFFFHYTSLCISRDKNLGKFLMLCFVLWVLCCNFLSIKIYVCIWVDLLFVNNKYMNHYQINKFLTLQQIKNFQTIYFDYLIHLDQWTYTIWVKAHFINGKYNILCINLVDVTHLTNYLSNGASSQVRQKNDIFGHGCQWVLINCTSTQVGQEKLCFRSIV